MPLEKRRTAFLFALIIVFLATFRGTCDHTVLRGRIVPQKDKMDIGETIRLDLTIPQAMDKIHRIRWEIKPEDIGRIEYKEYPVRWDGKEYGKEDRIAFFTANKSGKCTIYAFGFYKQTNPQLIDQISLEIGAQNELYPQGMDRCKNLLSGVMTPLKDHQSFEDRNYTAVTMTSREAWDRARLPKDVLALEGKGYECSPYPKEFDYPQQGGNILAQPEVRDVRWECVLSYEDYRYLAADDVHTKTALEGQAYTCKQTGCRDDNNKDAFVFFCFK